MDDCRFYFLKRHGTLGRAASELGIYPTAFSLVINGLRPPSASEREKLRAALSPYLYRKFFGKPKVERIEGEKVA